MIAFDTELTMEGIFAFLENSIGHYAPNIIQAFRMIGDMNDADILEEICQLAPPDIMRGEFISENQQEYDITTFNDDHELNDFPISIWISRDFMLLDLILSQDCDPVTHVQVMRLLEKV